MGVNVDDPRRQPAPRAIHHLDTVPGQVCADRRDAPAFHPHIHAFQQFSRAGEHGDGSDQEIGRLERLVGRFIGLAGTGRGGEEREPGNGSPANAMFQRVHCL